MVSSPSNSVDRCQHRPRQQPEGYSHPRRPRAGETLPARPAVAGRRTSRSHRGVSGGVGAGSVRRPPVPSDAVPGGRAGPRVKGAARVPRRARWPEAARRADGISLATKRALSGDNRNDGSAAWARSTNRRIAPHCDSRSKSNVSASRWQLEWRDGQVMFSVHPQHATAGNEDLEAVADRKQLGNQWSRGQQVLQVVQHQQEALVLHVLEQCVAEWFPPGFAQAEGIGDGEWNVGRVFDGRQVDEYRAVREVLHHADQPRRVPDESCPSRRGQSASAGAHPDRSSNRRATATSRSRPMSGVGDEGSRCRTRGRCFDGEMTISVRGGARLRRTRGGHSEALIPMAIVDIRAHRTQGNLPPNQFGSLTPPARPS